MKTARNEFEVANPNAVINATEATTYVKPTIEVIEMEMEGAILGGSGDNFGNGGHYGRD